MDHNRTILTKHVHAVTGTLRCRFNYLKLYKTCYKVQF